MRLEQLDHTSLSGEQKALYDDMRAGIETSFKGFTAIDPKGDLIGPWNPWLTFPRFGGPVWNFVKALATEPRLAKPIREIAILVTGTHFHAGYELYAHVLVAELRGLPDEKIRTIVAGCRPADLTPEEALAYDFAHALSRGGTTPEPVYRGAIEAFGQEGTAEFIYLVSLYAAVSVTLNGFDVPVPEAEDR